ncbi:MAG: TlpA disulfide reductase family protein [Ginsengibacter sp.]
MKYFFITAIISSTFISCFSVKNDNKDIIILGHIKNLPSKVYLTNANNYKQFIDSAVCINDKFIFHIRPEKNFHPFMAGISYINKEGKMNTLEFQNNILSKDLASYDINAFILEYGTTSMEGAADVREDVVKGTNIPIHIDSIVIKAGQETDAFFSTQMMNFGYLDGDVKKRTSQLNNYISIIKNYPSSQFLLSKIDENKSVVNKEELTLLLKYFNSNALDTRLGKKMQNYLVKKVDNPIFENLQLEDNYSKTANIFDSAAKVNMVLVWASWCEACRQEIPEIKKIDSLYGTKGLTITSISIDEDKKSWHNALEVENMSWRQLIVSAEKKAIFNTKFEVSSIPYTIFLNSKGKLLSSFIGYDKNSFGEYKKIIDDGMK